MNRIGLKVNGIWCVLPQDVSISIEEQNPLFSDSGSYSYPIELSVSQNRELFKSIDHPHGVVRPQDLDGLPFELWFDGVMLLYGTTETDEDLDIDEDKCSINLVSGNGDFQSKIEGMQCTDVPLLDKVLIGRVITEMEIKARGYTYIVPVNQDLTMSYSYPNVSFPYDTSHPYCNVRICVKRTDDYNPDLDVPYWVYDADRSWSGTCFYVAYFLDCLFNHLGITIKENNLPNVDDMLRLAFFTTKCEHELGESVSTDSVSVPGKSYANLSMRIEGYSSATFNPKCYKVYATNKNFPSTDVSSVLESLFNAFGLKIIYSPTENKASLYYIRDILKDNSVEKVEGIKIQSQSIAYSKVKGVKMTYGGDEKDTAYNYSEWGQVEVREDYKDIVKNITAFDKTCYVNKDTGNKYRIKISEEAEKEGDVNKLYPSLFEVGQFVEFVRGKDEEPNTELKISFTPVIENDVTLDSLKDSVANITSQRLAVLVDAEMKEPSKKWQGTSYTFIDDDGNTDKTKSDMIKVKYENDQYYDVTANEKNPLLTLDSGFALGVMRGPGSEAGTEVFLENYDGNGNDAWTTVVADYAFTSDTMDAYGNRYDYNGTAEGGVADQENSISLKTHIQTAHELGLKDEDGNEIDWGIDAQAAKRGLADRFMSEYMYFLLHRKTVSMDVDTTLSQLTSLSWFKQLHIHDTVGRLKSRKYTLSNDGVSDMSVELYTTN